MTRLVEPFEINLREDDFGQPEPFAAIVCSVLDSPARRLDRLVRTSEFALQLGEKRQEVRKRSTEYGKPPVPMVSPAAFPAGRSTSSISSATAYVARAECVARAIRLCSTSCSSPTT